MGPDSFKTLWQVQERKSTEVWEPKGRLTQVHGVWEDRQELRGGCLTSSLRTDAHLLMANENKGTLGIKNGQERIWKE